MRVTVKLFAQIAEGVGQREITLELPDDATVREALDTMSDAHPTIAGLRDQLAVAVNEAYARPDRMLQDGDTMALISPVSGG